MNTGSLAVKTLLAAGVLALAAAHPQQNERSFQGWVDADFVFVGADEVGRVETLSVREGDTVSAGVPLFTVDADLQKDAVLQGEASLTNAQQTFNRAKELVRSGSGTRRDFDSAQSTLSEAEARLSSARTRLARREVFAPTTGTVHQIYFRPGEVVAAGRPVISLLPPGNIKIRFFVPEALLPQIKLGDTTKLKCDGCVSDIGARIDFISKKAEYTPPVIYTLEERAKLVFLIEARPQQPDLVRVGQPVRVAVTRPEATP
jgi:HlyD family secretion protein